MCIIIKIVYTVLIIGHLVIVKQLHLLNDGYYTHAFSSQTNSPSDRIRNSLEFFVVKCKIMVCQNWNEIKWVDASDHSEFHSEHLLKFCIFKTYFHSNVLLSGLNFLVWIFCQVSRILGGSCIQIKLSLENGLSQP